MKIFSAIIFFFFAVAVFGQVDSTNQKAVKLSKQNLTYIWTNKFELRFIDTQRAYGFKIQNAGCVVTRKIKSNNRKVVRKINKVYGKNWFEEHREQFYY